MKTIAATYLRPVYDDYSSAWLNDVPVTVTAEVEQFGDDLLVIWTSACLTELGRREFTGEELVGAQEAIEEAWWASEREACRAQYVRQRLGLPVSEVA